MANVNGQLLAIKKVKVLIESKISFSKNEVIKAFALKLTFYLQVTINERYLQVLYL